MRLYDPIVDYFRSDVSLKLPTNSVSIDCTDNGINEASCEAYYFNLNFTEMYQWSGCGYTFNILAESCVD